LQQQLKQRGALDETWQPPSLDVQLPTPEIAADTTMDLAAQVDPAEPVTSGEQPAVKTRKRRVGTTQTTIEADEAPIDSAPVAKTRKRRTPAASAEHGDETEPVTTEKAS
jgi:hypothetical protein